MFNILCFKAPSLKAPSLKQVKLPPSCNDCKYSLKNRKVTTCKLFNHFLNEDNIFDFYVNTEICRSNETLCGTNGKYFKER